MAEIAQPIAIINPATPDQQYRGMGADLVTPAPLPAMEIQYVPIGEENLQDITDHAVHYLC